MNVKDRDLARKLYAKGNTIEEIASILGVSRPTVYAAKRQDKNNNIDWEELLLLNNRSEEEVKAKETIFLNSLINAFDKFIVNAEELAPETLEKLHIYARTYWNLKAPKQLDEKEITIKAAKSAIEKITNIALQEKNMQVAEFLSKNADLIIGEIFKDKK